MKRFLSLLLALTLALALAIPASADAYGYTVDGKDVGIIGSADSPTFILVREDSEADAEAARAQREATITALGGVVGQTNVLLNDKCIAFTDAAPEAKNGRTMVPLRATLEAMGAQVDYDQATRSALVTGEKASFTHVIGSDVITLSDGTEVKMDVASYATASNRTMVPVRFFSQVLGYDVFWDNDYKLAFLMDEDTWAAAVDKDLTILNSLLAQQSKSADLSKTQKSTLTAKGAVKVVDSINGDKSYPYSGSMTVLAGKDAANLTMSLDLSSMLKLLESLVEDSIPAEYRAQLAKFSAEAILSDKAYIKSPLLDAMSESKSGTWYALGELNYSELYQQAISAASASASATTFGHLLYAMMQQGDANHFFASWEGCTAAAQLIKLMYADSTFVKSGSGYQWHFGLAELAKLMNSMDSETNYTADSLKKDGLTDFALDMTVQGASATLVCKMAMADESGALATLNMTVKSSGNQASAKGSVQVRNLCEVTFDLASTAQTTSENVKTAPAAGANIVDLGAETLPIAG